MIIWLSLQTALAIFVAFLSAPAVAQSDIPPIPDGEVAISVAKDCSILLTANAGSEQVLADQQKYYAKQRWEGQCVFGLAHGSGRFVSNDGYSYRTRFFYGRRSPHHNYAMAMGTPRPEFASVGAFRERPGDEFGHLSESKTWVFVHATMPFDWLDRKIPQWDPSDYVSYDDGKVRWMWMLQKVGCTLVNDKQYKNAVGGMPKNARCEQFGHFYVIEWTEWNYAQGATVPTEQHRFCPALTSINGCSAVVLSMIDPHLPRMREIVAEADRLDKAWEREIEQSFAAHRAAQASAMAKRRADEDAKIAAEKAEFDRRVAAAPTAGALYALADEMIEQADDARARIALRALISRYPDSPLASKAIDLLAQLAANDGDKG